MEQGCCSLARGAKSKRPQRVPSYTQTSPRTSPCLVELSHPEAESRPSTPPCSQHLASAVLFQRRLAASAYSRVQVHMGTLLS